MLTLDDLHVSYGAIKALHGISFSVEAGSIVTLIGSNGAGKSTTLRTISGLIRPQQGGITYDGERIETLAPHAIVARGDAERERRLAARCGAGDDDGPDPGHRGQGPGIRS